MSPKTSPAAEPSVASKIAEITDLGIQVNHLRRRKNSNAAERNYIFQELSASIEQGQVTSAPRLFNLIDRLFPNRTEEMQLNTTDDLLRVLPKIERMVQVYDECIDVAADKIEQIRERVSELLSPQISDTGRNL
ncbi:uncharacterized protein H6S33_008147 [Morchella sextelata]|jgi:hypothetical protein|uniref:uncharacterized protein n=1 Tax=Morchella sextelata TaxID=1174677 RepID=UPI001D03A3C5|nr:uncharacterized protein H6S33_008147 [Morchella sextelata]KAH0603143.1 hypothetical protein H6S33_008147 [Morchella sextelata]